MLNITFLLIKVFFIDLFGKPPNSCNKLIFLGLTVRLQSAINNIIKMKYYCLSYTFKTSKW